GYYETNVVSGVRIFWSRVSQPGNQANLWSRSFHVRSICDPVPAGLAYSKIRNQEGYFFCSFSFGAFSFAAGAAPGASPSSFFSVITSGPAAAASASTATGSSSTTGARTEKAVKSAGTFAVTPDGSGMSRT